MRNFDENFMDILNVLSFMVGIKNLEENLSQSDKDDIMRSLDEKNR